MKSSDKINNVGRSDESTQKATLGVEGQQAIRIRKDKGHNLYGQEPDPKFSQNTVTYLHFRHELYSLK